MVNQGLGNILLLTTVLFGLVNCSTRSDAESIIEDRGDLIVIYEETNHQTFKTIRDVLEDTQFFDDLVESLNEDLAFPDDITVVFTECDESNAYYDREEIEITMCYELIADYITIFEDDIETEEDYANEVIDASSFTFFHELGHAVIDLYELPITGNEEDAADNFAAILLLDAYEDDLGVISGMLQFEADAEDEDTENLTLWGEHSLNSQRFYNMACLIYGSDTDEFDFIVKEGYLPEERAEQCEAEYEQKSQAWWTLLEPFFK